MRTLLVLATLGLFVPLASAEECSNTDPNATPYDTALGRFYVTNDDCNLEEGCGFSLWIYAESNNIPGLQRADEFYNPGATPCPSDTDIF